MTGVNSLISKCVIFILLCFQLSHEKDIEEICTTCRDLVEKFHEGMKKTAKNHFGGGDTAWEESRLGSYARSETRLLEILETVCKDSSKDHACHAMVEEHEEEIENFWFKKQNEISDLENHLCINIAKVCCATGRYGKTCEECTGGAEKPCSGHGQCNGNGTRGGTGKCDCDDEYAGDLCDECSDDHYNAGADYLTCKKCHETCESSCSDGTNTGCDSCKDGYIDNGDENGCVDIDECEDTTQCEEGKFCINEKGSYRCNDCDPACAKGCTGTGRRSCNECNPGWKGLFSLALETGGCEDINECEGEHNCEVGTYCFNKEGSHSCELCHKSCSGGCTNGEPNTCVECAEGYKMSDEGCIDIDECTEKNMTCPLGKACVNKDGPDSCEPCYENCRACVSTEAKGCILCEKGFRLGDEEGCQDVDECKDKPCKIKGEKCHNTLGSYSCKCKKGWVRTKNKDCKKKPETKKKTIEVENEDTDSDSKEEL